jgi:hypothetical protein
MEIGTLKFIEILLSFTEAYMITKWIFGAKSFCFSGYPTADGAPLFPF